MVLDDLLISQFAKITKSEKQPKSDTTVYGTIVEYDGSRYMKIDGSDLLTPISSLTMIGDGERVSAVIKNHSLVVTGNATSPAVRMGDVEDAIGEFEQVYAENLEADRARITELETYNVTVKETLTAQSADIETLTANNATIEGKLEANDAFIESLQADNAAINGKLVAVEASVGDLEARDVEIEGTLEANKASIDSLQSTKLSASDADLRYANIDFTNIGEAAMEYFYANSGLISNVTINEGTITGNLVGVTIKGDIIEGGTVIADKLVIQGSDGLYYKLNTDGVTTETEQTEYNSLNGNVILAQSITATKISVDDLVAFDATIGGFKITENSIYSGVKETIGNTTRGTYMDNDGQMAFGDGTNFVKFFKDTDDQYKLLITAQQLVLGAEGRNVSEALDMVEEDVTSLGGLVSQASVDINSIYGEISSLVVGTDGTSLMTQTENGWVFDMTGYIDSVNTANDNINTLSDSMVDVQTSIDSLNGSVVDLGEYKAYIDFSTSSTNPYILLGSSASRFKVKITNEAIQFMQDDVPVAYISNQKLHIEDASVTNELQQGNFVWEVRSNGNYGLSWKG